MITANIHLHFNGQCREALRFYEKCLGGKTAFSMTWGESPAGKEAPAHWAAKIIHATFEFKGQILTADDAPPGSYFQPQGFEVSLNVTDIDQAKRIFKALSQKGKILMPFAKTFWSPGFGMLVDKFGVPWMISTASRK